MQTLTTWYNSPEYQPLIALRQAATDMNKNVMMSIDGA
jgi:uncharacterized protein (DUF1330 family)